MCLRILSLETPDTATFIGFAESTRPCPLCLCWCKRRYQKRKGLRRRCGAPFDDSFSGSEKGWLSGFLVKLRQVVCIITSISAKGILRRFLNFARTEINSGGINLWEISQQSTCDMSKNDVHEDSFVKLGSIHCHLYSFGHWLKSLTKHPKTLTGNPRIGGL